MCGLAAIFNINKVLTKAAISDKLNKMINVQKHRGPDDEGIYIENEIGLGSRRLSILDLTNAGHMPMVDEVSGCVIVFNGEVYNYLEIKNQYLSKENFKSNTVICT